VQATLHISRFIILLLIIGVCVGCGDKSKQEHVAVEIADTPRDLSEIIRDKKLTVLVENSTISYFIYRGQPMGLEYEILHRFAKEIGVQLEMKIVKNLDDMIPMLLREEGDLISCNYTVTKERMKEIDFSEPYMRTPQVLVQCKPEDWETQKEKDWKQDVLTDPEDLARKEIHVWGNSSYYKRLEHLQEELGDTIYTKAIDGDVIPEEIIEWVSTGIIDYTITDKNVAQINQAFFPNIDIDLELSISQKIAFGLRKKSPALQDRLDAWLVDFMKTPTYRYILHKYLNMKSFSEKSQDEFSSLGGGKISKYDKEIQQVTAEYNFDWRLFSAIVYQESKFKDGLESWAGAYGLMQFMPSVGPVYGVYPDSPPIVQLRGGMKKIQRNYNDWKEIPDSTQRMKFTLATYNAGLGHIKDAQRLAKKHGKDPLIWDDNVELFILKLSKPAFYQDEVCRSGYFRGVETHQYVRKVFIRYNEYARAFEI
jgi:membrane-bound lytic murein transglycosylase F